MLDFMRVRDKVTKTGHVIYPYFLISKSDDLMLRGKSFYAIWDEASGFWRTDEFTLRTLMDREIKMYVNDKYTSDEPFSIRYTRDSDSNAWNDWLRFVKSMPDMYHDLDDVIRFSNQEVRKEDYITATLPYPIQEGSCPAYDTLMNRLYSEPERRKLEWAIGSIITGDSKTIQKFLVLYGGPGTGKSTFLNIVDMLFPGRVASFDAKTLVSPNNSFAMEAFKSNPLIAIQHDGDLSKIDDNSRLNSIVSHEKMTINEKFKSQYEIRLKAMLFMGTNKPVKITDAKSGILRRLIDVQPTGNTLDPKHYEEIMDQIPFELPQIANHCLQVYLEMGKNYYNAYIPENMIGVTNDFYNFIVDNIDLFLDPEMEADGMPLNVAWRRYKSYCEEASIPYPFSMRVFKDELKNYFMDFKDRYNGKRNVYFGFTKSKFQKRAQEIVDYDDSWLKMDLDYSCLDTELRECKAQYAKNVSGSEIPETCWDKCYTSLHELDTHKIHYVRPPENMIVIDFDLKNALKEKSLELCLEAAKVFPPTYAEISKGGNGLHLHYYWDGDVKQLQPFYDKDIEIKIYTGKLALRRRLSWCNGLAVTTISSGLPLREKVKDEMISDYTVKSERKLRELILRHCRKEIVPSTSQSVSLIKDILDKAYASDLKFDVTDMRPLVQQFCMNSTHSSDNCMRLLMQMKWHSEEPTEDFVVAQNDIGEEIPIVFFDVEVFPNLFVICWKKQGEGNPIVKMINPSPSDVEELFQFRLIGYNNRRYDNHIIYARAQGYSNQGLFDLSQRIINGDRDAFFREAYNLSYTDIYDFATNDNRMSLKKWEINLGINHQEMDLPWDQPVPEELWEKVADYCCNDVFATEAVWDCKDIQNDWVGREILADIAGMTPNTPTNTLTQRLIFGNDRHPQDQFVYTDLSTIFPGYEFDQNGIDQSRYKDGVKIVKGKSIYRGYDPSEGGFALGHPGIYLNSALLDIVSIHPHSAIALNIFGDLYTKRFADLVEVRVAIKHGEWEKVESLMDGLLVPYAKMIEDGKYSKKAVANALKLAINSVYGLTSASFENAFRDPRNVDNIIAKYGALFMITLMEEVEKRGYTVIHIKTDSIKIANADMDIINFCMEFARQYGYEFEHEASYERMCIVNDAVYIAKHMNKEDCMSLYGYIPEKNQEHEWEWTATGAQFKVPYVFKRLFSHEPITFKDRCEVKSVTTCMYLDFNEGLSEDDHDYRFVGKVGEFCPMKDGAGGGILLRQGNEDRTKFAAPSGTKKKDGTPWRWMESEMVKTLGLEDQIDESYYQILCQEAIETIEEYGSFEWFADNEPSWMFVTGEDEIPFEQVA